MARVFVDLHKIRLEMAGIGNEGGLQCAILAGRAARPLAELLPPRATASPSGPKGSRPEADP